MPYPHIYLGQTPATAQERRTVRERALRLAALFARPALAPATLLLHGSIAGASAVDVVVLRPMAALAGTIIDLDGPLRIAPGGRCTAGTRAEPLLGPCGAPPLECVRQARDQVAAALEHHTDQSFARMIGALIVAPVTHPDSKIELDIDDHRQQIKVLGLDELPALASLAQTGISLSEPLLDSLPADAFGARLWHDGEHFLFEISRVPLQLRVLGGNGGSWPLLEGANFVGRRHTPRRDEYRVTLAGDDMMSNDHALLLCAEDGRVLLRDTSTNGTWVAAPGEPETRLHRAERQITPGTTLRMGATLVRLEPG